MGDLLTGHLQTDMNPTDILNEGCGWSDQEEEFGANVPI